jgi:LmbE family N-acetylglucosaminyl deacetylase
MDAVMSDRVIEGRGTPAAEWQDWLAHVFPPPSAGFAPVMARARLVVIAPHPDDEVLMCGGLLSSWQRAGEVLVVAISDGEASHADVPPWTPMRLAAVRRNESDTGLRLLGVDKTRVVRLGLPDGEIALNSEELTADLQALLRPGDVAVSTWRLDGHPDHEATGAAAAGVCRRIGCTLIEAPVWMWHWARLGDPRVPWGRLHSFALDPSAMARKRAALSAHKTQLTPRSDTLGAVLEGTILDRAAWSNEYFFI